MEQELLNMLHLQWEPVGVFLGNTSAVCDMDASPEKRNCCYPASDGRCQRKSHFHERGKLQLSGRCDRVLLWRRFFQEKPEHT